MQGLVLHPNYLSSEEHDKILAEVAAYMLRKGDDPLISLTAQVGEHIEMSNRKRKMANLYGDQLKGLPHTYAALTRLFENEPEWYPRGVNALQINQYQPHHGCTMHRDAMSIGETIGMFSLGSTVVMDFSSSKYYIYIYQPNV